MDGISFCFLSACSCSSHFFFLFFFLSSTDKIKLEMSKYSSKRGEVHRENPQCLDRASDLSWLRKSSVIESSLSWGICLSGTSHKCQDVLK